MTRRKVITMCAWNRPAYLRRALDALRGCDGIADYLILPHVEPGDDEVRATVEGIDFAECLPTFNRARLGTGPNTENSLLDGFSFGDFVIHIEDDILCAPDALRYYEWCRDRFADDPSVFSVTGYNRRLDPVPPGQWHQVRRRRWFHPWGWATWRDRWERFAGRLHDPRGWDVLLNSLFCREGEHSRGCHEVYPELSRSQNIGLLTSSRTGLAPEWYAEHHCLKQWAGDRDVPAGAFRFDEKRMILSGPQRGGGP